MTYDKYKVKDVDYIFIPSSSASDELLVLYLGGNGNHIDHGPFWDPGTVLGACQWEAWYMGDPQNPSQYIIADGYGGAHALLWSGTSGNICFQSGGVDQIVSFGSANNPPPGVFSHFMVGLRTDAFGNQFIENSINGIAVGETLVPAGYMRSVPQGATGAGTLYVGGSDHSNAIGWLQGIRGWDTVTALSGSAILGQVFFPDRNLTAFSREYNPPNIAPANFCVCYVGTANQVIWADLSHGYDSNGAYPLSQHPGAAFGAGDTYSGGIATYPLPHPIAVPSPITAAPFYYGYVETPPDRGYSPKAPPVGAKRYDSFSRPDQTYSHVSTPDIGSTESGSLGPVDWKQIVMVGTQTATKLVQLFDRSFRQGDPANSLAYIPAASDSPDMTVTVSRIQPSDDSDGNGMCGVAARVAADGTSGFYAFYQYIPGVQSVVYLFRMDAQQNVTQIGGASVTHTGWAQLSLICAGTTIRVLIDATEIVNVTDANWATQTGAGVPFSTGSTNFAVTDFAVF